MGASLSLGTTILPYYIRQGWRDGTPGGPRTGSAGGMSDGATAATATRDADERAAASGARRELGALAGSDWGRIARPDYDRDDDSRGLNCILHTAYCIKSREI